MKDRIVSAFHSAMALGYSNKPVTEDELTTLVRVFIVGWGEAMVHYNVPAETCEAVYRAIIEDIVQDNFTAGDEWRWWL